MQIIDTEYPQIVSYVKYKNRNKNNYLHIDRQVTRSVKNCNGIFFII